MSENNLITTFTKGRSRLLQMARRLLESQDDAEDALQEAFSRLWPRASTLRSMTEAEKLASVTVRNISIDQLRHRAEHPTTDVEGLGEDTSLALDTEAEQERHEQYRIVRQLIDTRLTPLQQRIVQLHDIEELGYDEIARREGKQEAAVRMQLSRARKTIRECYKQMNEKYGTDQG